MASCCGNGLSNVSLCYHEVFHFCRLASLYFVGICFLVGINFCNILMSVKVK